MRPVLFSVVVLVLVSGCGRKPATLPKPTEEPQAKRTGEKPPERIVERKEATPDPKPTRPEWAANLTDEEMRAVELIRAADVRIGSVDLATDYKVNRVEADEKYKGKKVYTFGSVVKVDKDITGRPTIAIATGEGPTSMLFCYLDKGNASDLVDIRQGWGVSVLGTCKGKTAGFLTLDQCRVSFKASSLAELQQVMTSIAERTDPKNRKDGSDTGSSGQSGSPKGGSVGVRGYTRKDGTHVAPYTRSSPKK